MCGTKYGFQNETNINNPVVLPRALRGYYRSFIPNINYIKIYKVCVPKFIITYIYTRPRRIPYMYSWYIRYMYTVQVDGHDTARARAHTIHFIRRRWYIYMYLYKESTTPERQMQFCGTPYIYT